jgi:hypothetical protein
MCVGLSWCNIYLAHCAHTFTASSCFRCDAASSRNIDQSVDEGEGTRREGDERWEIKEGEWRMKKGTDVKVLKMGKNDGKKKYVPVHFFHYFSFPLFINENFQDLIYFFFFWYKIRLEYQAHLFFPLKSDKHLALIFNIRVGYNIWYVMNHSFSKSVQIFTKKTIKILVYYKFPFFLFGRIIAKIWFIKMLPIVLASKSNCKKWAR